MDDPVADILAQRARMDRGASAAIALSFAAHAGITALAVWTAMHHTAQQVPSVMNIRFAKMPAIAQPAAVAQPRAVTAAPKPVVESKPVETKPAPKPVAASPFGKSSKKATPPAAVPAQAVPTPTATSTQPEIAIGGTGVTALEGGDFPYTIYIERMKTLIGSRWFRPQVASTATTTVYFVIDRDGTVRDARTETPSGNATFDRAALRAILESSPLPPLPFGYSGSYLGVHLTFR